MPPKAKLHKDKGKLKSIPKTVMKSPPISEPSTSSEVDNQVQFEVELLWCIQQLQAALNSGKLNPKQTQESTKTLNTLMSNSAPIIRKRQLMRLSFGDYRTKMAEEQAKYSRKNEQIVYTSCKPSKKSVFVKKAPFLTTGKDFKFNFTIPVDSNKSSSETAEESMEIKDLDGKENKPTVSTLQNALETMDINNKNNDFHFAPSKNTFRFNFNIEME